MINGGVKGKKEQALQSTAMIMNTFRVRLYDDILARYEKHVQNDVRVNLDVEFHPSFANQHGHSFDISHENREEGGYYKWLCAYLNHLICRTYMLWDQVLHDKIIKHWFKLEMPLAILYF